MFPTRSDTNRAVQPHKMARGLKFWIWLVDELYYPYSENKGADQLRGYREADLRLCFRICQKTVFSRRGSYAFEDHFCIFDLSLSNSRKSNHIRTSTPFTYKNFAARERIKQNSFNFMWGLLGYTYFSYFCSKT